MHTPYFTSKNAERAAGLAIGVGFGFLLQRSGVTLYDNLVGQLLLERWVVVKVMLSAVLTGMVAMRLTVPEKSLPDPKPAPSLGSTVLGGLVFGAGFALLGYCPGTAAGAMGQGSLDALVGGAGMVLGGFAYARFFPCIRDNILDKGRFGTRTLHGLFGWEDPWRAVSLVAAAVLVLFLVLEIARL